VFKKSYRLISRILFDCVSNHAIIYLAPALLPKSCCLPTGIERAVLSRRFMWHYSMQGLPARIITKTRRELLPHVFTLTIFQWQLFSVALSVPTEMRPGA
jgi:hypothetical protein